ncbi:MAG TPA: 2OG-Fe(II) oxygenase [Gammaproteobacteria bacterium]|nr:2OG-Fe(II) oxygenase [Gammaproteobacteria bacterium]
MSAGTGRGAARRVSRGEAGGAAAAERGGALDERIRAIDWHGVGASLDERGCAAIEGLLDQAVCSELEALYANDALFRSRVVMARHGFGRGEYKYFDYPLPDVVETLRGAIYPELVPIANRWNEAMRIGVRYPATHAEFLSRCHAAGQSRPTPLLLRYEAGDYNCLHQDLYGEHVFPVQLTILLSAPRRDFEGGEFVLTEQRPRMQSRAEVVPLAQGDAVVFAVHRRPVQGSRGAYRVNMRHGVSRLRSGRRYTLGLIFHDAA